MYRDFLAQFMRPEPPKGTTSGSCLPEAAAGLPLDAAQFLVLRQTHRWIPGICVCVDLL